MSSQGKKIIVLITTATIVALILFTFLKNKTQTDEKTVTQVILTVGHVNSEGDPSYAAWEYFKEALESRSRGYFEVQLFSAGQAGDERELIEAVRNNQIDLVTVNVAPLAQSYNQFNLFVLPYLWRDSRHMFKFIDGEEGQELISQFQRESGIIPLSFWSNGVRHTFQREKPIHSPQDFEGMTVRIMNNSVFIYLFNSFEAKAVPIASGEVHRALVNGVVDAADNDTSGYRSMKFYEGAPYFSLTGHVVGLKPLLASKQLVQKIETLPQEQKSLFYKVVDETSLWQQERYVSVEDADLEWMKNNNIKVNEIENREPFEKLAEESVWPEYYDSIGKTLIERARVY